jgi:hypothetical protein
MTASSSLDDLQERLAGTQAAHDLLPQGALFHGLDELLHDR